MMFWNSAPRIDKVNELLKKENVSLIEILEQDSISSSVRNSSNKDLFDFLSRNENMEELLKWALTDEYKDHKRYAKIANAAVTIFSSSKPFQQIILENPIFLDKIKQFTTSKPPSSRTCGHYLRIIESIANGTKGDILTQLTNFPDFLINNITDMALKDLFVLMATEFTEPFGFSTDLLIKLVSKINDENCLFIVSAIRDIIRNNNEIKSAYFDSEDFLDYLFKAVTETVKSQPLLATELLRLLKNFKDLQSFTTVKDKYNQTYEYQVNFSLPFQVQIFGKLTQPIFEYFFDPKSCSLLVESIYKSFTEKSQEERCELTKNANLHQRIKDNFGKSIVNSQILDLAKCIFNDFKDSPESDQDFNSFFEKDVEERLKLRDGEYGGRIMNDDEEYEYIEENPLKTFSDSDDESGDEEEEAVDTSSSEDDKPDLNKAQAINISINSDDEENSEGQDPDDQGEQEEQGKSKPKNQDE